jgi:hypothetical protein
MFPEGGKTQAIDVAKPLRKGSVASYLGIMDRRGPLQNPGRAFCS